MTNLVDRLPLLPRARSSRGLTLIEMLVALAVTLVMMAAVVNLFANMSASIRNRRAAIETGAQLRQTRNRLAMDLSGATCRGSTWQDPAENQGYIEIIEGEWSDKRPSNLTDGDPANNELDYTTSEVPSSQAFDSDAGVAADGRTLGSGAVTDGRGLGDWDDILALTTQSEDAPFAGKVPYYNPVSAAWEQRFDESHQAEVLWFAEQNGIGGGASGEPGMRRIYRRAFLIMPSINFPPLSTLAGTTELEKLRDFYSKYDVSVRIEDGRVVGNTLGDLTKREHRYLHNNNVFTPGSPTNGFPHELVSRPGGDADWLVLNNALAFDVRVFDPGAPLYAVGNNILEPGDYGWAGALATAGAANASGYGAYCDLGWGFDPPPTGSMAYLAPPTGSPAPLPLFNEIRPAGYHPRSSPQTNAVTLYPAVYDTWSYHYENDGINQDNVWQTNGVPWQMNTIDQGANGLDDDGANGVDDRGERETAPPYDVPLKGVKVILRVYEPDSRQIRESSVTHSFKQ